MSKRASRVCAAAAVGLMAALSGLSCAAAAPAQSAAAEDIRDIRGPRSLFPWASALELLAGGVLLAVAAHAVWRRRRRRPACALQYFEIALQRLQELRALMHPASVREFSSAISDTVRRYIEAGFRVTATHRTTEEFLHDILEAENSPLSPHRSLLAEFLHQCDLAKFAGMSLSAANMESLYQSARSFIVGTSPGQPTSKPREARDSLPAT
ncbi:MAG: DUF4381 family protein [Steroidobacteraceae bacterium]